MISRLVLVGVVGALGISVPTWPEVQEWMGAAHSWTAYQLAVWDASCAQRGGLDHDGADVPTDADRDRSRWGVGRAAIRPAIAPV